MSDAPSELAIPDCPNYLITNDGHVINVATGREIFGEIDQYGYRRVTVRNKDRQRMRFLVHRMVAGLFVSPEPFAGAVVRHMNHQPLDNRRENLRWGTIHDNIMDTVRDGRNPVGLRHGMAKLSDEQVIDIFNRKRGGERAIDLAAEFDVNCNTVYAIASGRSRRNLTGEVPS